MSLNLGRGGEGGEGSKTIFAENRALRLSAINLIGLTKFLKIIKALIKSRNFNISRNNKKRSHTQLDSRKQVIAFQDKVITYSKSPDHVLQTYI